MPEEGSTQQQQQTGARRPSRKDRRGTPPGPTKHQKGAVAEVAYGPVDKAPVYRTSRELGAKCGEIVSYMPNKFERQGVRLIDECVELQAAIMQAYQEITSMHKRLALAEEIIPHAMRVLMRLRMAYDNNVVACVDYNRSVTLLVSIETQTRNWIDAMRKKLRAQDADIPAATVTKPAPRA